MRPCRPASALLGVTARHLRAFTARRVAAFDRHQPAGLDSLITGGLVMIALSVRCRQPSWRLLLPAGHPGINRPDTPARLGCRRAWLVCCGPDRGGWRHRA